MTIHVYTFCWNEMEILPFVVDYWKKYADHVYVYDNGSTDGSIEFLEKFDWITVRHFETPGKNNTVMKDMKNSVWKESKGVADWVVVCDLDEFFVAKDIRKSLQRVHDEGYTIIYPNWYTFVTKDKPVYEEGKMLHDNYPLAQHGPGKVIAFEPNKIDEINFTVGSHQWNPKGVVKYYGQDQKGDIYTLHICNNLGVDYKIKKYEIAKNRRSQHDIDSKHGMHYTMSQYMIKKDYNNLLKGASNFADLVKPD